MWVDVSVFGLHHIYQHPTSTQIYHGTAHDPEGLLGYNIRVLLQKEIQHLFNPWLKLN